MRLRYAIENYVHCVHAKARDPKTDRAERQDQRNAKDPGSEHNRQHEFERRPGAP
jgi:hypothetical protein